MINLLESVKFDIIIIIVDFMFKRIFYSNLHYYYYRKYYKAFLTLYIKTPYLSNLCYFG